MSNDATAPAAATVVNLANCHYNVVRNACQNIGLEIQLQPDLSLIPSSPSTTVSKWDIWWMDDPSKFGRYQQKRLRKHQRINHFPGITTAWLYYCDHCCYNCNNICHSYYCCTTNSISVIISFIPTKKQW